MNEWIDKSYLRPSLKITRQSARPDIQIYPTAWSGRPAAEQPKIQLNILLIAPPLNTRLIFWERLGGTESVADHALLILRNDINRKTGNSVEGRRGCHGRSAYRKKGRRAVEPFYRPVVNERLLTETVNSFISSTHQCSYPFLNMVCFIK
jgi:hypothetical protein